MLSLALSENNQKFIKDTLGINKIEKVKFDFKKENYKSYNNSGVLEFIKRIHKKSEYTISELQKIFNGVGYTTNEIFKFLYIAFTPKKSKILSEITIKFNQHLTVEDLSEGEKKLLLVKAALEFEGQEDSLFFLDEPDAHIHINNKETIVKTFESYKRNRQIILTTHSPTVTQCFKNENIFMLDRGKIIPRKKQEIIYDLTNEFWNKHQQNLFLSGNKDLILFVEGKHDKIHITNAFNALKEDFKELDFDIYQLGGVKNISPFIQGLCNFELKQNVTFIAIYDNDSDGETALKNKKNFNEEADNCGYQRVKESKFNNLFAFKLIKPKNHTTDCTIENLYEPTKYEEAYKEALEKRLGKFENISIKKISENISEDSKNILAENSKNFTKNDFENFRNLFELVLEIQKQNKPKLPKKIDEKPNEKILLFLKTKKVEAKGFFNQNNNSFTLFKGSQILKGFTKSISQKVREKREKKLKSITNEEKEDFLS